MGDHEVILKDLRQHAEHFEDKARAYGEGMGAPYRDAAEELEKIADTYGETVPDDPIPDE